MATSRDRAADLAEMAENLNAMISIFVLESTPSSAMDASADVPQTA
jgi:hypothetical protein